MCPREYSIWCDKCLAHHPVHTQEPCLILFVTEDQELSHGCKSHMGGLRDSSFRDRLEEEGITQSQMTYINVRDGGAFADNLTWLSNLMQLPMLHILERRHELPTIMGLGV